MPSRRQWIWIVAALAVLAVAALMMRPAKMNVQGALVSRGPMRVTIDEDGQTRVRERWVVSAPVTGRLDRLSLEVGDAVEAGQELLRIEPAALDPRMRTEAEATAQAARAALEQARSAELPARTAAANARRETERSRALAAAGALSPRQLELAEQQERDAEAALSAAVARVAQASAELARARAAATGPEGGRAAVVRAPVSGRVIQLLQEQQRVIPAGTPVLELGDPGDLEIVVDLRSEDAVQVSPGTRVLLDDWGGGEEVDAVVKRVEPGGFTKISALGVEEQRVNVIVSLPEAPRRLGDRYRVGVRLVLWQAPDVLRVPAGALFRDATGWGVYVVERGQARRRPITIGHQSADWAEVLQGLAAGDTIILHPSDRLSDGVRVSVALSGS